MKYSFMFMNLIIFMFLLEKITSFLSKCHLLFQIFIFIFIRNKWGHFCQMKKKHGMTNGRGGLMDSNKIT